MSEADGKLCGHCRYFVVLSVSEMQALNEGLLAKYASKAETPGTFCNRYPAPIAISQKPTRSFDREPLDEKTLIEHASRHWCGEWQAKDD